MKVDHFPYFNFPCPLGGHRPNTPRAKLGPSGGDQVRLWEGVGDALSRCHALSHSHIGESLSLVY